jgi:putative ABC transport system permease protein
MSLLMTVRIALKALGRNKLRTSLTMLGMIIGVAAVITMVALGTGAQTQIEDQVKSAGTNMILVNAGNWSVGGVRQGQGSSSTLTVEDAEAIRALPGVQYVSPGANTRAQVIAGNQNWSTRIEGTGVDMPLIRSWPTRFGAYFTQQDVQTAAKVAVLGSVVSDTLFGEQVDPTGQGTIGHGPGPGRHGLRPLYSGAEEADGHPVSEQRHGFRRVGRPDALDRGRHHQYPARPAQDRTGRA